MCSSLLAGGGVRADTAVLPSPVCWLVLNRFFSFYLPSCPFPRHIFPFVLPILVPFGRYDGDKVGVDTAVVRYN